MNIFLLSVMAIAVVFGKETITDIPDMIAAAPH